MSASLTLTSGQHRHDKGQPGHDKAWTDPGINADTHNFYRDTRATLEAAWVRPRHNGYMPFQHAASELVNAALLGSTSLSACVDELNRLFAASQKTGG